MDAKNENEWFETKYENCFINKKGQIKKVYKYKDPKIFNGFIEKAGYLVVSMGCKKKVYIHRLMGETFLDNPTNLRNIDHINRDKLDNRIENLRWFSQEDNMLNRHQVLNVFFNKDKNRWIAKSGLKIIGQFKTEDEAKASKYGFLIAKGINIECYIDEDLTTP